MLFLVEFVSREAGANDTSEIYGALLLAQIQAAGIDVIGNAPSGNVGVIRAASRPRAIRPVILNLTSVGRGDDVVRRTLKFVGSDGR